MQTTASTDVVILCGGRGARLGELTTHRPKPLLYVGGRPFLFRVLGRMKEEGFTRIILAVHYLAGRFRAFISTYQEVGGRSSWSESPSRWGLEARCAMRSSTSGHRRSLP